MQSNRIISALLVLILSATFSCSKEKAGNTVQFKGIGSEYVTITSGNFFVGDAQTNFTGSSRTWESAEINIPDSVHDVNVTVVGSIRPGGFSGNLQVQVFINGELKAEKTSAQSAGSAVIVIVDHSF